MGKSSPAFQFYSRDFLDGVITMSNAEVGAYIRMLAWSWGNGPLPLDEARMARIISARPTELRKLWVVVGEKWTRQGDGWINVRLEQQRATAAEFSAQQSERGKRGAEKRHGKPSERHGERHAETVAQGVPDSSSALCTLHSAQKEQSQDQKPRVPRSARELVSIATVRSHLRSAAHQALEAHPDISESELSAELKDAAAAMRAVYDGTEITRIIDAVRGQREKRRA